MKLSAVIQGTGARGEVAGDPDVLRVTGDSREVVPGSASIFGLVSDHTVKLERNIPTAANPATLLTFIRPLLQTRRQHAAYTGETLSILTRGRARRSANRKALATRENPR